MPAALTFRGTVDAEGRATTVEPVSINDRTTHLLGFDLREQIRNARDLAESAAKARALHEHMEHTRKVVLAEQIIAAQHSAASTGKRLTVDMAESIARTSKPYRDHLEALREANEARGTLYAKSSAAERAVELGFRQLSFLQTELRQAA